MHLIDAPEEQSNLQTRLNDAEKRATEAEMTAQEAQAAFARALLDGARVAADATARSKAESEATLKALRPEFETSKRSTPVRESLPGTVCSRSVSVGAPHRSIFVHNDSKPNGIGLTEWDLKADRIFDRIIDASDDGSDLGCDRLPVQGTRPPFRTVLLGLLLAVSVVSYSLTLFSLTHDAGTAVTAMASSIVGIAPTDMLLEGAAASATRPDPGASGKN